MALLCHRRANVWRTNCDKFANKLRERHDDAIRRCTTSCLVTSSFHMSAVATPGTWQ